MIDLYATSQPRFAHPVQAGADRAATLGTIGRTAENAGLDPAAQVRRIIGGQELWKQVFPQHAKLVQEAWSKMEPTWPVLREFRNRAGFHVDKPPKFFGARYRLRLQIKQVEAAMLEFEKLFKFFLKTEANELPDLEEALDALLDELEIAHLSKFNREQFKAYTMIPNTRTGTVKKQLSSPAKQ